MITNKMFERYYQVSSKILHTYSPTATIKSLEIMSCDESVLKIESILKTNPTEEEFLQQIEHI